MLEPQDIAIIAIGFSVVAAILLLLAYLFFLPEMRKNRVGKASASILLLGLCLLQLAHYLALSRGIAVLNYRAYYCLLFLMPVSFYFFSNVILFPTISYNKRDLLHFFTIFIPYFAPLSWLAPLAFLLGSFYTAWFTFVVWRLRHQRNRFRYEFFFFGMFALMALMGLILGWLLPYINHYYFYLAYSGVISASLICVLAALMFFPELLTDIHLITEMAYAKSKLNGVDIDSKVAYLEHLMQEEKLYENEDLTLAETATALGLSPHQLSELVNRQFQQGFPKYVRLHRIRAAKNLLAEEPNSSILAVSMATGFKSQSSFYAAFNEIVGMSPGEYRNIDKIDRPQNAGRRPAG